MAGVKKTWRLLPTAHSPHQKKNAEDPHGLYEGTVGPLDGAFFYWGFLLGFLFFSTSFVHFPFLHLTFSVSHLARILSPAKHASIFFCIVGGQPGLILLNSSNSGRHRGMGRDTWTKRYLVARGKENREKGLFWFLVCKLGIWARRTKSKFIILLFFFLLNQKRLVVTTLSIAAKHTHRHAAVCVV